jgi:carbon monoxide dehydrogenase subunit G
MQLTSQQTLPVSQLRAWAALNDTDMLQASIPGCESLIKSGDNEYEVLLTASVGPVKAKFKGKLKLSDLLPPESYKIAFEGQGGAAGHGKGSASVRLEPTGDDTTTLHYSANAQVGGKIAQIGSRLIDMTAQKMAGEFFAKFDAALRQKYPAAAVEEAAPAASRPASSPGFFGRLVAWFKRLLGK